MPSIRLPQGTYRGATNDGIDIYHGIPYAQPFKRFQPPKAVQPSGSESEIDATKFGPICPQPPSKLEPYIYGPWPSPPKGGEPDEKLCGVLSVYQPEGAGEGNEHLPVIVYAHGGAWQTGSSQIDWYTGTALARDSNCIVVTINYRAGVLGFLYQGEELSCGIQDHILALEWVRENIGKFGGNTSNITTAGQSAGAYNTQLLLDLRPDLMDKAIIMSSPADRAFGSEDAKKVAETVRKNLPDGKSLTTASTEEIITAQKAAAEVHRSMTAQFAPVIADGVAPGGRQKVENESEKKGILVTWMQHDGSAFAALSQGYATKADDELSVKITDGLFKDPSIRLAERVHQAGHNVTTLEHQWAPEGYHLGATHCLDLPLLLGDSAAWSKSPMRGNVPDEEWDRRGKLIRQAFGKFAREGKLTDVRNAHHGEGLEGTEIQVYAKSKL